MAAIADIHVGDLVGVIGTVTKVDPDDRHFQGISIKLLAPSAGPLEGQIVRYDASQVETAG